jgi:uncharacterized damage-inducible protein DinB
MGSKLLFACFLGYSMIRSLNPRRREIHVKQFTLLVALVFVAGSFAPRASAQESSSKAVSAKPIPGPSAALLKEWNEIGRKLIAMAEDFPESKYDFKAAPTTGTFAQRLIHAGATNYFFTNPAMGQKPPADDDPPRSQFKDKTAVVAYVKKSFADGAAAIEAKGDKGITEAVVDPFAQDNPNQAGKSKIRLIDLAHAMDEHSGETYGQLTVYYRVAGMVPPESRPPQK